MPLSGTKITIYSNKNYKKNREVVGEAIKRDVGSKLVYFSSDQFVLEFLSPMTNFKK